MSFIQRIIEALDARLWKFIRIIHSANHDFPYHDYFKLENTEEEEDLRGVYAVGTNNVNAHGDQSKRFVSKRANIWTDSNDTIIVFNDSRNVRVTLPPINGADPTTTFIWEKEFYTNISAVYYIIPAGKTLYMYFEGVLPEEARDAE